MGRRSGGGRARAAPRRAAPSAAPRPAQRRAAPAPSRNASSTPPASGKPNAPPPAKAAPAAAPAPAQQQGGSGMGGFMANVASTGLGVAVGRGIDRALFGGGSGDSAQAPAGGEYAAPMDDYGAGDTQIDEGVCAREIFEFKKCLERTGSDITACKWNMDILTQCQEQQASLGFAEAGRF